MLEGCEVQSLAVSEVEMSILILPSDLLTPVIEPIDAIEHFSDKSPHCDQRLRASIEKRSELRTNRPATDLFRPQLSAFISMSYARYHQH